MTHRQLIQNVPVYPASALRVSEGVAKGDPLSFADELILDDNYRLGPVDAPRSRLSLAFPGPSSAMVVAKASALGRPGQRVHLDATATFMSRDGRTHDVLILVELAGDAVDAIWILPLAPLAPDTDYRLVGIDRGSPARLFAQVACVAFARGTRITLSTGEQCPIEEMSIGDAVLTRDDGAQTVRWIGRSTMRAVGDFAPVTIRKGALHNENDLVLSPDQRVLIYQRSDALGAGRAELLIRVSQLVNGETVTQADGGFVDYFQLLLDRHQIIFAEGIAAESLLIDTRTRPALPPELAAELDDHADRNHARYDVAEELLGSPDIVELLRRASAG